MILKRILSFIVVFAAFISCEDKVVIYEFKNSDIELEWYLFSHISSVSPDVVEIKCNGVSQVILESKYGLQEVAVVGNIIMITHLNYEEYAIDFCISV